MLPLPIVMLYLIEYNNEQGILLFLYGTFFMNFDKFFRKNIIDYDFAEKRYIF